VYGIVDPSSDAAADKATRKVAEMESLIQKYTADFPKHSPSGAAPGNGEVLLVTGTTGALGTTILAQLVANESISKVYALNRKGSGKTLKERQTESLVDRGYDAGVASSSKIVLVEGDPSAAGLGLSEELYNEASL